MKLLPLWSLLLSSAFTVACEPRADEGAPPHLATAPVREEGPAVTPPRPPVPQQYARDAAAAPVAADASSPPAAQVAVPDAPASLDACQHGPLTPQCTRALPKRVSCPKRFEDVDVGSLCGIVGVTEVPGRCTYTQGICACAHRSYCGGATPNYVQQSGMQWQCKPPPSPDDCPDSVAEGAPCSRAGKECSSSGCGTSTSCVCTKGRFRCQTRATPSPPSASLPRAAEGPLSPPPPK